MGTPDFEFAIRGRTFQTLAEEQLHRNLPRRETIDFDLPLDGDDEPDVALELGLRPHRIRVDLQQNGDLHLKAEIEVSILSLRRLLDLNHAFPSGSEIDETGVVMPEVPVVPLEADLGDAGLLIGVPLVSLDVVDFLSKPTATGDLELHAVLDPFSFIVLPNIGGLAQVLTRRLGSVLDRLIGGVFGDTHLGEVLRQVVDFAERVAQRILVLTKLPERILEALADGLEDRVRQHFLSSWRMKEISILRLPSQLPVASASPSPGGGEKGPVAARIVRAEPRVHPIDPEGGDLPEVILEVEVVATGGG